MKPISPHTGLYKKRETYLKINQIVLQRMWSKRLSMSTTGSRATSRLIILYLNCGILVAIFVLFLYTKMKRDNMSKSVSVELSIWITFYHNF